jgi:ketosteroid isomerase-like protein
MKRLIAAGSLFICIYAHAQKNERSIRDLLSRQTLAWNEGNTEGFMKGYWESDSLKFIGKNGITYGWSNALKNYKKNYPDTAAMGKLDFTLLELKKISGKYYFVIGRWHLQRSIGDIGGHFSLLFHKIKGHWKIITDHTS